MHCLIASPGAGAGLPALPQLESLLRPARELPGLGGEAEDLHSPLERCLAQARGAAEPGLAAWAAADAGLPTDGPIALLSPLHLQLDAQQAVAGLVERLSDEESRALFDTLVPLFPADEGWQLRWLDAQRWLLRHESLVGLRVASLERIAGRPLTPWLPAERWLRRLQNEAQMLLHEHPVNQARSARGLLPVNSVWLYGSGPAAGALPADLNVLRPRSLEDWQELPLTALRAGHRLTIAGGARARSWQLESPPRWRWPWSKPTRIDLAALLDSLEHHDD